MRKSKVLWLATVLLGTSIVATSCGDGVVADSNVDYLINFVYEDGEKYLFEAKGGSLIDLTTFELPTVDYKKLEGFYTDENRSTLYDYSKEVHSNLTLYVKHVDNVRTIKSLKDENIKEQKVIVSGVVGYKKRLKGLPTTNDPEGNRYNSQMDCFYLFDDTASILVYDRAVNSEVKVGNKITLKATYTTYILEDEIGFAQKAGYTGSRQLINCSIVSNDNSLTNTFDNSLVSDKDVYDITVAPTNINLTGNVYNVRAKIEKKQETGFINYYLYDQSGVGSLYVYTNNNGSDYAWLDEYADNSTYYNVIVAIYNAKCASNNSYFRVIPLEVNDKYVRTKEDVARGAAITASRSINNLYYQNEVDVTLNNLVSITDTGSEFNGATIKLSSSNEELITINNDNKIVIKANKTGKATITFEATLNEAKATFSKEITVTGIGDIKATNIQDIYSNVDSYNGQEVTVKGVVVGYSWKAKAGNKGVYYVNDGTNTMLVSPNNDSLETTLEIGQEVIYTGTFSTGKEGDRVLNDAQIKYYSLAKKELNYTFKSYTVSELVEISAKVKEDKTSVSNISGEVYETTFIVKRVDTPYAVNFVMVDPNDESKSTTIYSNGGAIDKNTINFLDEFNGKKVKAKIGIRDEYYKAKLRIDVLNETITLAE